MQTLHFFLSTFLNYSIPYSTEPLNDEENGNGSHGHGHAYGKDKQIHEGNGGSE